VSMRGSHFVFATSDAVKTTKGNAINLRQVV
jgi:hypothetical protein